MQNYASCVYVKYTLYFQNFVTRLESFKIFSSCIPKFLMFCNQGQLNINVERDLWILEDTKNEQISIYFS